MSVDQILGAVELGLIYGVVALGVYLSFRILDFPDLTVDGSFPLGAGVAAVIIVGGGSPWTASLMAMVAGLLSGLVTAWLNRKCGVLHLLSSILTMTALYSINLRMMGAPNIPLIGEASVFTSIIEWGQQVGIPQNYMMPGCMIVVASLLMLILFLFLTSEKGLALRATGANQRMAEAQGIATDRMVFVGLALSNALIALAGALFAQTTGFADITIGAGTIVVGLAAVILGEAFFPSRSIFIALFSCLIGAIAYRISVALALNTNAFGLQASDLNLVTSMLVGVAMIFPKVRRHFFKKIEKKTLSKGAL